jgi:hypothetical protein
MFPAPAELLQDADFQRIIHIKQPYCLLLHRRQFSFSVRIFESDSFFNIEGWKRRTVDHFDDNPLKLPRIDDNGINYCGQRFVPYCEGSLGWFSELFDRIFLESCEFAELEPSKVTIWMHKPFHERNSMLLMTLSATSNMQNTKAEDREAPIQFFEILLNDFRRCFTIFSLTVHCSTLRKQLVFSSDGRWALNDLSPILRKRANPPPIGTQFAVGSFFGKGSQSASLPQQSTERLDSVCITRVPPAWLQSVIPGLFPSQEEYLSPTILTGILPDPLLGAFDFWRQNDRYLFGYPKKSDCVDSNVAKVILEWWGSKCFIVVEMRWISEGSLRKCTATILRLSLPQFHEVENMVLVDISHSDPTSSLGALASRMVQLDNASHILVWSLSSPHPKESVLVNIVELPRLRLRFIMKESPNGTTKLYSMDHTELFVCEDIDAAKFASKHSQSLLHGILLQNDFSQTFLLVPNYGLHRIEIRSCPFSNPLISLRSESEWLDHVQTCYYLYPIHVSGCFLQMSSFSAALYMVVLCLMRREYEQASELLSSCSSNGPFTPEEKWITAHLKSTSHDSHPNAHALRLRFAAICVEDCPSAIHWDDVEEDLFDYLQKYEHVSSICRLTSEEERMLLEYIIRIQGGRRVSFSTNLRLQYLNALLQAKTSGKEEIIRLPRQTKYGAARLRTLFVHSYRYSKSHFEKATGHLYFNYRRPNDSDRVAVTGVDAFLLLDKILSDNMYGQSHNTGFLILYEMLTGRAHIRLCPNIRPVKFHHAEQPILRDESDQRFYRRIVRNERFEGPRLVPTCVPLAKLITYSLFFRYNTSRGLPPDTGCSFAFLPLLLSAVEDSSSLQFTWKFPSLPYSKFLPLMTSSSTGPSHAQQMGFWGDKSPNGIASEFERLLTEAVVDYSHSSSWSRNGAFHYRKLKFPNYFCELGNPARINVFPTDSVDCRPEINLFDRKLAFLAPFECADIAYLPENSNATFSNLDFSWRELEAMGTHPLNVLELHRFITLSHRKPALPCEQDESSRRDSLLSSNLSGMFDIIQQFPVSQSSTASNILHRMKDDLSSYISQLGDRQTYHFNCLSSEALEMICDGVNGLLDENTLTKSLSSKCADHLRHAFMQLTELQTALSEIQKKDTVRVCDGIKGVELLANQFPLEVTVDDISAENSTVIIDKLCFLLQRQAGIRTWLSFHLLCRAYACNDSWQILRAYNPFLSNDRCAKMMDVLSSVLLLAVRISQTNTSILGLNKLRLTIRSILELQVDITANSLTSTLEHEIWNFSAQMKRLSLEMCDYEVEDAADVLQRFSQELSELKVMIDSYGCFSSEEVVRLTYILFHLSGCKFKDACLLIEKINLKELLDLQSRRCCYNAFVLIDTPSFEAISRAHSSDFSSSILRLVEHSEENVASIISSRRHYFTKGEDNSYSFDPRFLIFEFVSSFLLHKRQVELVEDFVTKANRGESSVQQMIMGAGKTTVISPLLALFLSNGQSLVTIVVPAALLEMSRTVLRKCFSNIITKRVYSFHIDRLSGIESKNPLPELRKLRVMLEIAKVQRGIVCTTPESVKSLMLMNIEAFSTIEHYENDTILPLLRTAEIKEEDIRPVSIRYQNMRQISTELSSILKIWSRKEGGIALLDEIDTILHPLHSELNFPIGPKESLHLSPDRWIFPLYLFRSIFQCLRCSPNEINSMISLNEALRIGVELHHFQSSPHLLLLSWIYYQKRILPLITNLSIQWLFQHPSIQDDVNEVSLDNLELLKTEVENYISSSSTSKEYSPFDIFTSKSMCVLNLARNWITSLLPHCLSKVNRVHYGLMKSTDATGGSTSVVPRHVLAVPFLGKDVPSPASEFAHPDVLIGLSFLAYCNEGLRLSDMKILVSHLKRNLSIEAGPMHERPTSKLFENWLRASSPASSSSILPLEVMQFEDLTQLNTVHQLLHLQHEVIEYYLIQVIFPITMVHHQVKIQASGQDLGSDMIFSVRLGFSGTPSDVLPRQIRPCFYESGSEGEILMTLSNPECVDIRILEGKWSVKRLLRFAAENNFNCLIDPGALITGLTNEEVARFLLKFLPSKFRGCVYLDRRGRKMIVERTNSNSLPLERSGIPTDYRFTFFDQIHTTGMDITQPIHAKAMVLVGKDMSYRDYAQACWRMRGLGRGQSIQVVLVEEIWSVISSSSNCQLLNIDVIVWLLLNTFRGEYMQQNQLCLQDIYYSWRKPALDHLCSLSLNSDSTMQLFSRENGFEITIPQFLFFPALSVRNPSVVIKQEGVITDPLKNRFVLSVFKEHIDFTISSNVSENIELSALLEKKMKEVFLESSEDITCLHVVDELRCLEKESHLMGNHSAIFDSEIVQEQEQQQEKEQQTASGDEIIYSTEKKPIVYWDMSNLTKSNDLSFDEVFTSLSQIKIWNMHHPQEKISLSFPTEIFASRNHTSMFHQSHLQRRLKTSYVYITLHRVSFPFYIILSLSEIESLRFSLLTGQDDFNISDICLVFSHPGRSILRSNFERSNELDFQISLQSIRFFNCDFKFTETELDFLSKGLIHSQPLERFKFFKILLTCHDKMGESRSIRHLTRVFQSVSIEQISVFSKMQQLMKDRIMSLYESQTNYFHSLAQQKHIPMEILVKHLASICNQNQIDEKDIEELFFIQDPSISSKDVVSLKHFKYILNHPISK